MKFYQFWNKHIPFSYIIIPKFVPGKHIQGCKVW